MLCLLRRGRREWRSFGELAILCAETKLAPATESLIATVHVRGSVAHIASVVTRGRFWAMAQYIPSLQKLRRTDEQLQDHAPPRCLLSFHSVFSTQAFHSICVQPHPRVVSWRIQLLTLSARPHMLQSVMHLSVSARETNSYADRERATSLYSRCNS